MAATKMRLPLQTSRSPAKQRRRTPPPPPPPPLLLPLLLLLLLVPQRPSLPGAAASAAPAVAATVCAPPVAPGPPAAKWCQRLDTLCLDQGVFVHYATRANPRAPGFEAVPQISLGGNTTADLFGFGDHWGTARAYPDPLHRPATPGEETRELAHPAFSACTVPLVLFPTHLYRHHEFFLRTVVTLHAMLRRGWYDRRMSLVVATLGMRLEPWHQFVLRPLSRWAPTTLSHLSARLPGATPEAYTPDGSHVRCFQTLMVCQTSYQWALDIPDPVWSAGQYILRYYQDNNQLPLLDDDDDVYGTYHDPTKLRVVIASRSRRSRLRHILNQQQVWSWCTTFTPPGGVLSASRVWNGTACVLHEFGSDPARDAAVAMRADIIVGAPGPALLAGVYMRRGGSLVEVRPYGWNGSWADAYMKEVTGVLDSHALFWWGIDVTASDASKPAALEAQGRGARETWARDRHTTLRLTPLQYIFERIVLAGKDRSVYLQLRRQQETHITDMAVPVNETLRRAV